MLVSQILAYHAVSCGVAVRVGLASTAEPYLAELALELRKHRDANNKNNNIGF